MFQIRWEFDVRPDCLAEFAAAYGPEGEWVRLFRQGAGYIGTDLTQVAPTRWVTVDRWESKASYEAFRLAHASAYDDLDDRCARFTTAERKLGETGD